MRQDVRSERTSNEIPSIKADATTSMAYITYIHILRPPYLVVFSALPYYCYPYRIAEAMRIVLLYNMAPILSSWHWYFCYSNCFDGTSLSVMIELTNDKQIQVNYCAWNCVQRTPSVRRNCEIQNKLTDNKNVKDTSTQNVYIRNTQLRIQ